MKQRNVLLLTEPNDYLFFPGIGRFAKTHGWHLTADYAGEMPHGWKGDGILTVLRTRRSVINFVLKQNVPVVDFGFYYPEIRLPRVVGDHAAIGAMAARFFYERHFRNVAWASSLWTPVHALRYEGLCRTLERLHAAVRTSAPLPPVGRWVWSEASSKRQRNNWDAFTRWLGRKLADTPKPVAILAYDDYDASRVLDVCLRLDIAVPYEVAIVGVDNNTLVCENQPVPLSSIAHDMEEVGYKGAELLERLMNGGRKPAKPIKVPPTGIVIRQSADNLAVQHPLVRNALVFIRDNITLRFGTQQIATALGVSRSTLDRIFLSQTGRTLGVEILSQRMSAAKRLLGAAPLKIADIAHQTGFCNAAHLAQVFTQRLGKSPKHFRAGAKHEDALVPCIT